MEGEPLLSWFISVNMPCLCKPQSERRRGETTPILKNTLFSQTKNPCEYLMVLQLSVYHDTVVSAIVNLKWYLHYVKTILSRYILKLTYHFTLVFLPKRRLQKSENYSLNQNKTNLLFLITGSVEYILRNDWVELDLTLKPCASEKLLHTYFEIQ